MSDYTKLIEEARGYTRGPFDRLAKAVEALAAERDAYAQGLWDAFAALGYDTDGDPTPAAVIGGMGPTGFVESILHDIREYRRYTEKDYDEVTAERDALQAQLDSMTTEKRYQWEPTDNPYVIGARVAQQRLVGPWAPVEGEQA